MPLLDLPPELFQHIVDDLISVAGLSGAWKYRQICRAFASEISLDLFEFARYKQDFYKDPKDRQILERGLDIYLLNRLQSPRRVNPLLLAKLTSMIDWLMLKQKLNGQAARTKCAEELCQGLKALIDPSYIIYSLQSCQDPEAAPYLPLLEGKTLTFHDKMMAATVCKKYAIVEDLLPIYAMFGPRKQCNVLALALGFRMFNGPGRVREDQQLLETVIKYLKSLNLQVKGNKEQCKALVTGNKQVFQIACAIFGAIETKQNVALKSLLDLHANHLLPPHPDIFCEWFRRASRNHNWDAMQLLIDFAPGGKSMLITKSLLEAFVSGNAAIMKATLVRMNITDMNASTVPTIPIFIAARSGSVAAVRITLEAGSDPNVFAASTIKSLNKINVTPLDMALYHKSTAAARYLLEHGANVRHVSEWPTDRASYDCLRDWEMKRNGARIPTWSEARRLRKNDSLKDWKH